MQTQLPLLQTVLSALQVTPAQGSGLVMQVPLVVHTYCGSEPQFLQAAPPTPQALFVLPARQEVPLQQPEQLLLLQVPPQPLSAPGHLPLQLGVQVLWQVPPLQVLPEAAQS